ncbi:MAG: hypothetical protein JW765_00235 [Deltaproteobacteria bacterium]|nr:hypothetical protein [Candidatus Zymogenaceae bacterium]
MNIKRAVSVAALLSAVFIFLPVYSHAQTYYFSVPSNYSDVYINQDGSVTISYAITFANDSGASPIDVVDIGLPNDYYDLSTAKAWIGSNTPITEIYKSTYIDTGVEVRLGAQSIPPGRTGTLYFQITNPHMVYTDDEKKDYASVEFSPTWYGSDYTYGTTDLMVNFHFPASVGPEETIYHNRQYDDYTYDKDGRIVFTFREPSGSPSSQYLYGVSFPAKYVTTVFEPYRPSFIVKMFSFFFDHLFLFFFLGMIGIVVLNIFRQRQRKMKYMPANVAIEGVGIKRGLTAPEAALLTDTPLNKVVTMILFGLLKKGIVRVETTPAPKVFKLDGVGTEPLRPYEKDFLACVKADGTLETKDLKTALVTMIKETDKALKGFSRTETTDYYRAIVDLAWKHVTAANTPELLGQEWDSKLEWMMMDKDYNKKMEDTFDGRDVVMPRWYGNYGPSTARPSMAGTGGKFEMPGAKLANEMVSSVEGFSGKLITNVESFVTGVSRVTNPPPQTSSGRSSGGGGGGCACACACAGCACACAGGGR